MNAPLRTTLFAATAAIGLAVAVHTPASVAQATPSGIPTDGSIADVAERVVDSVVNISTTHEEKGGPADFDPFYADPKFKGWFEELADKDVHPTVMPTHLEEFAFFKDSLVIKTSQEALLGDRTPEDVAKEWADYMTKAQQKHLKK